ncbi:hypothetical protein, partial [Nostoc sp. NOS(2021)]|uniref:hypothetical protein n=1 Tax=Nostoc sp. NOS(2021) TaxID=2815407 RepID=UPI0025D1BB6F
AKATLYLPSPPAGRGWRWGAMTMGITTNYPDMILVGARAAKRDTQVEAKGICCHLGRQSAGLNPTLMTGLF